MLQGSEGVKRSKHFADVLCEWSLFKLEGLPEVGGGVVDPDLARGEAGQETAVAAVKHVLHGLGIRQAWGIPFT